MWLLYHEVRRTRFQQMQFLAICLHQLQQIIKLDAVISHCIKPLSTTCVVYWLIQKAQRHCLWQDPEWFRGPQSERGFRSFFRTLVGICSTPIKVHVLLNSVTFSIFALTAVILSFPTISWLHLLYLNTTFIKQFMTFQT